MTERVITKDNQDFQYFPESELTELRNESFVRSYKKGQVLFYPGNPRNHLILLVSGITKIKKNGRSGNFSYLYFTEKQTLFPGIGPFQDEVHYDSAVAYMNTEVVFVPIKLFKRLLQDNPQQLVHRIQEQSVPLGESMIKIQRKTANDTCERIVTSLAMLLNDLGERIDNRERATIACPITINDIARTSGTTREAANGVMKRSVQMNHISYSHEFLTFLDTPFFIDQLSN